MPRGDDAASRHYLLTLLKIALDQARLGGASGVDQEDADVRGVSVVVRCDFTLTNEGAISCGAFGAFTYTSSFCMSVRQTVCIYSNCDFSCLTGTRVRVSDRIPCQCLRWDVDNALSCTGADCCNCNFLAGRALQRHVANC